MPRNLVDAVHRMPPLLLALSLPAACTVDPDVSGKPPPCADGYHVSGSVCVEGPGRDAGEGPPVFDAGADAWEADRDAGTVDRTGCALHFGFEEEAFTTEPGAVADDCGEPNAGTLGGAATSVADGVVGRAIALSGSGCVRVADAAELRAVDAVTMAAWIRPEAIEAAPAYGIVAKRINVADQDAYAMYVWEAILHWDIEGEESRPSSFAPAEFTLGEWRHVAVVFDASRPAEERTYAYLDGARAVTRPEASGSISEYTSDLFVGCLPEVGFSQHFIGALDEVYVFTRALSDAEIATLAAIGP
jgi:hypothetical protein